jgi:hypothetical protein
MCAVIIAAAAAEGRPAAQQPSPIAIDYQAEGSLLPPDFAAPAFLWRDLVSGAPAWVIEVRFAGGAAPLRVRARGERMRIGEIDPRCVAPTNEPPKLTPEQAAAHTWVPDAATWAAIKKNSAARPATLVSLMPADNVQGYKAGMMKYLKEDGISTLRWPGGNFAQTPMGKWRAANGHPQPYNVKIWGIGNEMYGPWQYGYMGAPGVDTSATPSGSPRPIRWTWWRR